MNSCRIIRRQIIGKDFSGNLIRTAKETLIRIPAETAQEETPREASDNSSEELPETKDYFIKKTWNSVVLPVELRWYLCKKV